MPKCKICGGEALKQPCITEEGKCDLCGNIIVGHSRMVAMEEEKKEEKKTDFIWPPVLAPELPLTCDSGANISRYLLTRQNNT